MICGLLIKEQHALGSLEDPDEPPWTITERCALPRHHEEPHQARPPMRVCTWCDAVFTGGTVESRRRLAAQHAEEEHVDPIESVWGDQWPCGQCAGATAHSNPYRRGSFTTEPALRLHQRVVHGPMRCADPTCDWRFNDRSTRSVHCRKAHGIKVAKFKGRTMAPRAQPSKTWSGS